MRHFYFLLLLISFSVHAQIDYGSSVAFCDDDDLEFGGDIQCGSLTISVSPTWQAGALPVNVRVNGDVIINAPLDLSGGNSNPDAGNFDDFFGIAGPGGGEGGHTNSAFPQDAVGISGGAKGSDGAGCGGGGGGGGYILAGVSGSDCGLVLGGAGGSAFNSIFIDSFRGGFGGGSGGNGISTIGGGGGGAGAIRIRAKGNITINFNLTANGGAGGDSTGDGGAGGGGSGGLIWLQAIGNITNNATITASAGAGGNSSTGGDGSAGSVGVIRLEDADGVISGSGNAAGADVRSVTSSSSATLKSDISCGMIKPAAEKDHATFFQMMMGFLIVVSVSFFMNRLKLFSKTQI
jgi:hypothetical protein